MRSSAPSRATDRARSGATIGRRSGYWVAAPARCHGVATRALTLDRRLDPGRATDVVRLDLEVFAGNEASQAVAASMRVHGRGHAPVDARPPGAPVDAGLGPRGVSSPWRPSRTASRPDLRRPGIGHRASARLYSARDIHICILVMHSSSRGAPCRRARRASPETGPSRTSSRSSRARRREPTSRSTRRGRRRACRGPTRSCPVRGEGLTVEDIDGNLFLDFAAGIAVNSTGHAHPQVVAAIKEQAAELIHFSRVGLLPADLPRGLPRAGPRSRRSRAGSGPTSATPARRSSRPRSSSPASRPSGRTSSRSSARFHGRTYGSVSLTASKAKYHAGFGPLLPGIFHAPYGRVEDLRWFDEVLFDKLAPGQRGRGDHRRADPGRGRLHRPRGRLPPGPARASATSTASCSSPTRSSRAPAGPARCGRSSTGASSPTSC